MGNKEGARTRNQVANKCGSLVGKSERAYEPEGPLWPIVVRQEDHRRAELRKHEKIDFLPYLERDQGKMGIEKTKEIHQTPTSLANRRTQGIVS